MEKSGDGKWITIVGPGYNQYIEIHNDDVVDDQTPLAEKIIGFLNAEMSEPWIFCDECDGQEGYVNEDDEWVPCPACDGAGGYAP